MSSPSSTQTWLERFITANGAVAGTVHHRRDDETLELAAAVNIPPKVQEIVRQIPRGKGMAGLAFAQNEPITSCNIKDDNTGRVRPGAKGVEAQAGVAFPVHDGLGEIRAIVGIAYREERDLTESELARLIETGRTLP
jgi:L-methionine (R)-S-oxide reductase